MADKPIEEQADVLGDLEQPNVDGPTPGLSTDFVRDSEPAPGTGPEELTPHGPGVVERDGGWTSAAPDAVASIEDGRDPVVHRRDET